jgi:ABC-type transport system involved in multi-copper enzyme maturation permease subunit
MSEVGLPEVRLDTITLAMMLVRAALIVWEAVLTAQLIIEEYSKKTIDLLYTYPVNRKKLIFAKLMLISGIMLLFHIASSVFQHTAIFLLSNCITFVTYSFEGLRYQILITVSTVFLSFIPLSIGFVKKSSIATIVSSIIIVVLTTNSQGSTAGLLSMPVIAVILGLIGVIITSVTVNKMISSDLYI